MPTWPFCSITAVLAFTVVIIKWQTKKKSLLLKEDRQLLSVHRRTRELDWRNRPGIVKIPALSFQPRVGVLPSACGREPTHWAEETDCEELSFISAAWWRISAPSPCSCCSGVLWLWGCKKPWATAQSYSCPESITGLTKQRGAKLPHLGRAGGSHV